MSRVDLREGDPPIEARLSGGQAAALSSSEIVRVTPGARAGLWLLRDRGLVGAARVRAEDGDIEVRITPKIPIDRLFFLLGYAQARFRWRTDEIDAGERPDLVPAVAHAFARATECALRQGVLLGYRETEEALAVVRGRLRDSDQLRRRYGIPVPVEVRYDDFTVDIAENRLVRAATTRLLRLPGVDPKIRAMLRHVEQRLADVERLVPGHPLPDWRPGRLNTRYHTALGLADLVLRGASYELEDGVAVRVDGLLLRMWEVYEDFVTVALSEALQRYGGRCQPQDRRHHLDRAGRVQLKPDLVYYRTADGGERPAAVVDAKYKIEKDAGGHNPDLYQLLAYCTVLGLERGHLVYAKGVAEPQVHRVQRENIEIVQHAVDLSLPAADLLDQMCALADGIVPS